MGFRGEAQRVRDESLTHGQRLRALTRCLERVHPVGFQPSWDYLEAKLGTSREDVRFLVPALDLLDRERSAYLDVDQRYAVLRRRLKRRGSRAPRPDDVTPRSPRRWHGDEREGAIHVLRWWLRERLPPGFVDDPEAQRAVDVARALAHASSPAPVDRVGLQASLRWARRHDAGQLLHLLGQIHVALDGPPAVGIPWNFVTPTDRTTGTSAVARESFRDPVGLWRATPGRASHVVDAATDLLVLGYDASALGELAGMSPCASFYDVDPVLTTVLDQVGAADLLGRGADRAGLEAHLGLFLDRTITLRELSTWAHQTIGHDGEEDLQPFVELDDVYDDWEYSGEDLCSLDTVTRQAARDFLAGRSVTRFDGLEPSPPAATTVARPPGWLDRLRRRGGQPAP